MAPKPKLNDLLAAAGIRIHDFNNWKRADFLTRAPVAVSGVAQEFTRAAALEVLFFAALRKSGFAADAAKGEVKKWLSEERSGLAPLWITNPVRVSRPGYSGPLGVGIGITERPLTSFFYETHLSDNPDGAVGWGGDGVSPQQQLT